ncbi:MAG TPA: polyprenyl synthetase family protein [Firmicutes bacterium]|nr:polyprenyl synthetase family protein [Bacillota bacterium]
MSKAVPAADRNQLMDYLATRREAVIAYIQNFGLQHLVSEPHLKDFLLSYPLRGGKTLRPAIIALSAGAVSGENAEEKTLPLQAAVELYHNWTLIHDDIIDEDDFRRGKPSLHREIEAAARKSGDDKGAEKYGRDIAILVGDLMHGSVNLLVLRLVDRGISPEVVLNLLRIMHAELTPALVDGETQDVRFTRESVGDITEEKVLEMLENKTAALFEYCGTAGALAGLNSTDATDSKVTALAGFSRLAGLAFQIQDDILGLVGDEDKLGKPRGSDLREGKHTLILLHAFREGTKSQLDELKPLVGKKDLTPDEVDRAERLIREIGSIEHVNAIARQYIETAIPFLDKLEPSPAKDLLSGLGGFMIEREF